MRPPPDVAWNLRGPLRHNLIPKKSRLLTLKHPGNPSQTPVVHEPKSSVSFWETLSGRMAYRRRGPGDARHR